AYIGRCLAGRQTLGLGTKNLLGLPWQVALALQGDGWIIRNAVVWHKPNAMPESVRDRMNCRYELIFLIVKSRRYWFDLDLIRIPHATARPAADRPPAHCGNRKLRQHGHPAARRHPGDGDPSGNRPPKYGPHARQVIAAQRYGTGRGKRAHPNGRNPGDV